MKEKTSTKKQNSRQIVQVTSNFGNHFSKTSTADEGSPQVFYSRTYRIEPGCCWNLFKMLLFVSTFLPIYQHIMCKNEVKVEIKKAIVGYVPSATRGEPHVVVDFDID
eukprot:Phypoly_transcript_08040.p1 GENE.Phypoly_transcript_08040~~Phypoly_transcript_08040.p1  ORF type:complete len:108 (-),score=16.55 Phypoly_transcript_08040:101-424(-)